MKSVRRDEGPSHCRTKSATAPRCGRLTGTLPWMPPMSAWPACPRRNGTTLVGFGSYILTVGCSEGDGKDPTVRRLGSCPCTPAGCKCTGAREPYSPAAHATGRGLCGRPALHDHYDEAAGEGATAFTRRPHRLGAPSSRRGGTPKLIPKKRGTPGIFAGGPCLGMRIR